MFINCLQNILDLFIKILYNIYLLHNEENTKEELYDSRTMTM
nr:MAG TPA: hypothetical protein [Caudoviricetes sp.]